jgi:hypothetical protein
MIRQGGEIAHRALSPADGVARWLPFFSENIVVVSGQWVHWLSGFFAEGLHQTQAVKFAGGMTDWNLMPMCGVSDFQKWTRQQSPKWKSEIS